jgi:hypothetical protein
MLRLSLLLSQPERFFKPVGFYSMILSIKRQRFLKSLSLFLYYKENSYNNLNPTGLKTRSGCASGIVLRSAERPPPSWYTWRPAIFNIVLSASIQLCIIFKKIRNRFNPF